MSKSTHAVERSNGYRSSSLPRAVIHKQILDTARLHPSDSMEELADRVSGASIDLVERVLNDYGDPTRDEFEHDDEPAVGGDVDTEPVDATEEEEPGTLPESVELSEQQRLTLAAIAEHPEATQRELAAYLDVSSATINTRVNSIEGFDWDDRRAFVRALQDDDRLTIGEGGPASEADVGGDLAAAVGELTRRMTLLERQLAERSSRRAVSDTDLLYKVLYACITSDHVTEAEGQQIFRELMGGDAAPAPRSVE